MATVLERLDILEAFAKKVISILGDDRPREAPLNQPDEVHELFVVTIRFLTAQGEYPAGTEMTALMDDNGVAVGVIIGDNGVTTILIPPKKRGIDWEVVGAYAKADDREKNAYIDDLQEELTEGIKTASRRAELLKECRAELSDVPSRFNMDNRLNLQRRIDEELDKP